MSSRSKTSFQVWVKGAGLGKRQALAPIQRDCYGVAVFRQALAEQVRHPAFVLDYQNSHSRTFMVSREPENSL
jgi:phosphoribosyl-AMP cyclohydrolase